MNVFRSRKRPDYDPAAYAADAARMDELARAQPGFIDYKSFAAPDGETVTISVWESVEAARAWGRHAEHLAAQGRGRRDYYAQYTVYTSHDTQVTCFP